MPSGPRRRRCGKNGRCPLEHFLFENALLTRKRQPPQRGVHSGENRVFRLNATFDFHKKSKVICSRAFQKQYALRCVQVDNFTYPIIVIDHFLFMLKI
ncbi:hypothetical protein [Desulfovibrio sp. ZJ200]|uniref:hypothetical protein n=1 Tax=Desulfovibrio sp. ZJ200 TaxID=2709792 RepID=UPI0013EE2722|nr:hypothetical protein [Desulfovibrio sp. ZJ200]